MTDIHAQYAKWATKTFSNLTNSAPRLILDRKDISIWISKMWESIDFEYICSTFANIGFGFTGKSSLPTLYPIKPFLYVDNSDDDNGEDLIDVACLNI